LLYQICVSDNVFSYHWLRPIFISTAPNGDGKARAYAILIIRLIEAGILEALEQARKLLHRNVRLQLREQYEVKPTLVGT
jgi:hypothetical protein